MNPLTDLLPPHVRRYAYAVVFLAGLAIAAWQAAGGDWTAFAGALIASLTGALAASNTGGHGDGDEPVDELDGE